MLNNLSYFWLFYWNLAYIIELKELPWTEYFQRHSLISYTLQIYTGSFSVEFIRRFMRTMFKFFSESIMYWPNFYKIFLVLAIPS